MELTSENVEKVFEDCLFKDGEDTKDHVKAEGIVATIGFHPLRLQEHKADVRAMLNCLPENFHQNKGGGWSFLNACCDKTGSQWTDLHQRMEQLFQLGLALKLAKWQLPREMWKMFPGGMPYVVVNLEEN